MITNKLKILKEKVYRANIKLYKSRLVFGTFGNVSGIERDSRIVAIKPSGVDYSELSPKDITLVDLNGNIIDSNINPSSDTKTHLELYKAFRNIGGVAHTHSRYATAWSQARKPIPCLGTTHADYFYGDIPCTSIISDECISSDYELETGKLIISTFKDIDYHHIKACLVASHGPFTWGEDAMGAVDASIFLEEIAYIASLSILIDPSLISIKQTIINKHYLRKHGKNAYYGQRKL